MKPDRRLEPGRCFFTLASLSLLVSLSACQADKPANVYAPVDGLAVARSAPVPVPATTPFDGNPQLRTEYLDAYRDGYRSGMTGMNILFRKPPEGVPNPRTKGWRDGADAGLKEYFIRKKRR
jgi:hypothetical protein